VTRSLADAYQAVKVAHPPSARMGKLAPTGAMIGGGGPNPAIIDFENWPADWRAWSSFGIFFVEDNEWSAVDPAHRRAVLDWVALGGRLVISPQSEEVALKREPHGVGELITLRAPLARSTFAELV